MIFVLDGLFLVVVRMANMLSSYGFVQVLFRVVTIESEQSMRGEERE